MKKLTPRTVVGIDTNIFVYYFDNSSEFYNKAKNFFESAISNKTELVTSALTVAELLSFHAQEFEIDKLYDSLLELPGFKIYDVDKKIASDAARIRRKYSYSLPDAIQLATALHGKAETFITNDQKLKNFKELKTRLLKNL